MAAGTNVLMNCRSCSKEIAAIEPKINCNGLCNKFFHKQCLKLTRDKVKMLMETPNIKWFCDQCMESTSVVYALLIKLQDSVNQLNITVHQQTEVINNQTDKMIELENNLNALTSNKNYKHAQQNRNINTIATSTHRINNKDNKENSKLSSSTSTDTQTKRSVIQEVNNSPNKTKIITSESTTCQTEENKKLRNPNTDNKAEFQIVQSKRRKNRIFVEGTCTNSSVKAVGKNAWIYATRLDKETTANQIQTLLSSICEVKCEKLNLRHSEKWSSFKICAPFHFKDTIINGNIWPSGAQIGRYFFPKETSIKRIRKTEEDSSENFLNATMIDTQNS